MELRVERRWKLPDYTIGKIYDQSGRYICDTLEDTDRGLRQGMPAEEIAAKKIYGKTAIPAGRYRVRLTYSPKFGKRYWTEKYDGMLPLLEGVTGFEGVRIHVGNSPKDTLGCILTGRNKVKGGLTDSTACFYKLMDNHIVKALAAGQEVWITIE